MLANIAIRSMIFLESKLKFSSIIHGNIIPMLKYITLYIASAFFNTGTKDTNGPIQKY